jgi:hypothetical protein
MWRRRSTQHVARAYSAENDGRVTYQPLAVFTIAPDRCALRLYPSGRRLRWDPLATDMQVRARLPWSSEIAVRAADGSYRARFRLPLTSARRAKRLIATRHAVATTAVQRQESVEMGAWWLREGALEAAGPSATVSLTDTVYLDGWTGRVRGYRRRWRRILDISRRGLALRGFRRHLLIPWEDISGLDVGPDPDWASVLLVHLRAGGEVRFANTWLGPDEVRDQLRPLWDELQPKESVSNRP